MQFKLLAAATLLTVISAQANDASSCLVKNNCKPDDKLCIGGCFEINKHTADQVSAFTKCGQESCVSQASDINKFNNCLVSCYNKLKGGEQKTTTIADATTVKDKPTATNDDTNATKTEDKDSKPTATTTGNADDKDSEKTSATDSKTSTEETTSTEKSSADKPKATTTTKAPVATPSSNAFKVVPSVFAAFVLAALAL